MTEANLFDGEELIAETSTRSIGDIDWTSKRNLLIGLVSSGFWYIGLVGLAVLRRTEYTITDQRIIEESGLIGKSSKQTQFEEVVGDINTNQSASQVASGTGDVSFEIQKVRDQSASEGNVGDRGRSERQQSVHRESVTLRGVKNHEEVAESIRRLQHES